MLKKIVIGVEEIEIDFEEESSITDIDKDMQEVSSQIGYYGAILAEAKAEELRLEAEYRKWRAGVSKDILSKDSKTAEWKVRAEIESRPKFESFKKAKAQIVLNVTSLESLIMALREKSTNLRSIGARERLERGSLDMTTKMTVERQKSMARKEAIQKEKHKNRNR